MRRALARRCETDTMTMTVTPAPPRRRDMAPRSAAVAGGACREPGPPGPRPRVRAGRGDRRAGRSAGRRPAPRARRRPKATASSAGAIVARLDSADAELALARAARRTRSGRRAAAPAARRRAARRNPPGRGAGRHRASRTPRAADAELAAAQADVDRFEALCSRRTPAPASSATMRWRGGTSPGTRAERRRSRPRRAARTSRACAPGARRRRSTPRAPASPPSTRRSRRWQKAIADATVTAPIAGIVTETIADVGELVQPRAPILIVTDLDRAWANVYVDEPFVPRLRVGQPATLFTDAGGQASRAPSATHRVARRVHAAQRADRRGPLEARLPRQDHRRQQETAC